MITYKQYMDKEYTHEQYYAQFGEYLIDFVKSTIGEQTILSSTDKHLNDIPYKLWVNHSGGAQMIVGTMIMNTTGFSNVALADLVCAMKSAAKLIKKQSTANSKD